MMTTDATTISTTYNEEVAHPDTVAMQTFGDKSMAPRRKPIHCGRRSPKSRLWKQLQQMAR